MFRAPVAANCPSNTSRKPMKMKTISQKELQFFLYRFTSKISNKDIKRRIPSLKSEKNITNLYQHVKWRSRKCSRMPYAHALKTSFQNET